MKTWIKVILLLALFFSSTNTQANIVISEIMYDLEGTDTGREWIEIYNSGLETVDLSSYKLFESDTNHSLSLVSGEKELKPEEYSIIVSDYTKFKIDWPTVSVGIFDSTFSLSNDGEKVGIKDQALVLVDEYSYSSSLGGLGDSKSLQKINGTWIAGTPTPGFVNTNAVNSNNNSNESNTITGAETTTNANTSSSSSEASFTLTTKIIKEPVLFTNTTTTFTAETIGASNQKLIYGKYLWNFGDGSEGESSVVSDHGVSHMYFYPGKYLVNVDYYSSPYIPKPDTSSQIQVEVISPTVIISGLGDEKDFYIELTNKSNYDLDISGWVISFGLQKFVFPKNSLILKNQKLLISSQVTKFNFSNSKDVILFNNIGNVIFDYSITNNNVSTKTNDLNIKSSSQTKTYTPNNDYNNQQISLLDSKIDTSLNTLSAQAVKALPEQKEKGDSWVLLVMGVVIISGVLLVYRIRKTVKKSNTEEEFEIIDE